LPLFVVLFERKVSCRTECVHAHVHVCVYMPVCMIREKNFIVYKQYKASSSASFMNSIIWIQKQTHKSVNLSSQTLSRSPDDTERKEGERERWNLALYKVTRWLTTGNFTCRSLH